jgi:hypothetical protein
MNSTTSNDKAVNNEVKDTWSKDMKKELIFNDSKIGSAFADFSEIAHLPNRLGEEMLKGISDFILLEDMLNKMKIKASFKYACMTITKRYKHQYFIMYKAGIYGSLGRLRILKETYIEEANKYVTTSHQIPRTDKNTKSPRERRFYNIDDDVVIKLHERLADFMKAFKEYLIAESD